VEIGKWNARVQKSLESARLLEAKKGKVKISPDGRESNDGEAGIEPVPATAIGRSLTSALVPASLKAAGWLWKTMKIFGPGLVTGAADDDPSGIATYSSVGAQFGPGMLWTMP
jgi:hypothetical protein